MPHITFIHGISNKPPARDLLRLWRAAVGDGTDGLSLGDLGITSDVVYWADLLYEAPDDDLAAYEGVLENSPAAIDAGGDVAAVRPQSAEEEAFLIGLRAKMTAVSGAAMLDEAAGMAAEDAPPAALERIPLPWFLKKRFLEAYLRDVHHYLFDTPFAPPGRPPPLPIRKTIRERCIATLGVARSSPHVVVSHSLGTVIAYDCLKRVADCPAIDGLITIGSPLGLDEVQDQLAPQWSREDGFPHERLRGGWINLFDRLDPVCGFDPSLANDFKANGERLVEDLVVENDGAWRHSGTKYLRQPAFRRALRGLLRIAE